MSDIQQALYDFDATIKAKPELTDSDLLELFPELEGDTARLRAAYDYSATLNSGKYKGPEEFNAKFPELFGEPEKPRYQMPTAEKQYVAPVLGGKQPEQAPQENILPDYKAMDAARTMTPAETMQTLNQGVPGVTRIGDTNISHLQTDMLMNEKFGGGYKDTSAGRTEEVTPVGEMETGVELVGAPFNPDEKEKRTEPEHIGHQIADTWNSISAGAGDFFKGTASYAELFSRNMEDLGIPGISDLYGVYADGLGNARKFFDRDAAKSRALVSNYDGKTYDELWKEGRYTDAVAHVFNKSAESIPITVASMGGMALGVPSLSALALFAPSAGNAYDEVRDRTDMTEFQKQLNANTIGVLEAATEYFGDKVIVGWLGDIFKKGGERLLKTKVAGPLRKIINDALKSNSLLIPPAIEGIEEVVNSVGQNMVDYFTGKTKVYKPFEGTFDSFVHGFAGGSQFAAVGAGKMAYDQGVEYVKGFEAKTNFNHSRKEYERLMSENGYAPADIQEIETQLIAATPEEAQKMIGQLVQNMDGGVIELENGQFELHEAFTQPLVDLYTSGKQLEHRSKKLQTKVQEFNQRAEQYVTDNLNPDMNALVFAEFQGQPVRVVSGVVQMKDKEIDTEVSTPEIYIETQDGIRIIPPQLLDARKGLRITPAQQAVQEIAQQAAEPVVAQHENEEVRPYNEGEIVRAEIAGSPVLGTIVGKTEQGYTIRDAQGMMIQIQPRQIINEDNLEGVDNESVVEYRDQSGAIRTGVVTDIHSERVQGYAYIDDQRIPFSDILGLKTDEVIAEQAQNAGSAPVTNSNLSETQETRAGATQEAEQAVQAQYPVTTKGELDFDNFTPEQLFSYTAEQYGEEAAIEDVKVSIAGLEAQLSKKRKAFEKMGMKERVKARAEISKIEAEIASFSNLIPTAPVESAPPAVESAPATQASAPVEKSKRKYKPESAVTEREKRWGEPQTLRELILRYFILNGRLSWNDKEGTKGLGSEYRNAESERRKHIQFIKNDAPTPEQLAHDIWEANAFEPGQFEDLPLYGYDTQQILDEILDVMNSYTGRSGMIEDVEAMHTTSDMDSHATSIVEQETPIDEYVENNFEDFINNPEENPFFVDENTWTPEQKQQANELNDYFAQFDAEITTKEPTVRSEAERSGEYNPQSSAQPVNQGQGQPGEGLVTTDDGGVSTSNQGAETGESGLTNEINYQSPELNPTEAQKEAGNYKKAHIKVQGMDITIENPKNSVRSGVDENGKAWSNTLQNHYGYFTRTTGKDGDQIDTFIGESPESNMVFVVDQNNPETGRFDESKVMLGFNSAEEAQAAYMSNYEVDWKGFGSITPVSVEDFKKWLYDGARQRKPFSEYRDTPEPVKPIEADTNGIEGKKKPEPTTVRELADYDAGEQKGYLSGMFFSGLEKGSKFKVARKDYEVTQYSKPKKVEFVGKKGNQITYDEITIRIKELATGKTITTKLITWPNGNSQFTGVESNQNHEQLSRDIEGDVNTDLINEYNRFHEKSDSFKIIQKQLDKLNSRPESAKPKVKPKQTDEAIKPQSPIDNLNAILSGEKVVEAPTLEDQLKSAEQKLSTVKKDRDKKYRRYLDLKDRLDEIGSRDQVDVEGNVGNGMLAFEELDKEAKEKVNAARKEYEPLNEQVKELESKIEKLQGRIKDQKMNQQEMNFEEEKAPEGFRKNFDNEFGSFTSVFAYVNPNNPKEFMVQTTVRKANADGTISMQKHEKWMPVEKYDDFVADLNKRAETKEQQQGEFKYRLTRRPPSIGTHPTENLISDPIQTVNEKGMKEWVLTYSKKLDPKEVASFELTPVVDGSQYVGKKVQGIFGKYIYTVKEVTPDFVSMETTASDGRTTTKDMSITQFVNGIDNGSYKLVDEQAPQGKQPLSEPDNNAGEENAEATGQKEAKQQQSIDLNQERDVINELGTGKSVDNSPQQKPPVERSNYGNTNKIVSNERYEELKRRMKGKLGNLNVGFDPELLAIGTEMAAYHIEAGARKFADFAKRMIEDLGDGIRPYLKSFYQGSRYMPGMEPLSVEMDDSNSVNNFDVNNLNIQQDVLDRPDSSESDSKNPNDVQPDESSIPNDGRGSQQQRNANESRTPRTRNKRNGGKSGSGLFSDLFGEESDNGISQQDGTKKPQSNDAGNQQSTGDVIDSTEGLSDLDSGRPNTDTQDDQSNGEQAETFAERTRKRIEQQKRAESIKNKSMDINNIRETLPMLLPEQQDDVLKAETRFFSKDHNTGPLAYGKGMLFTNGTGTGKTYTGLGIIKRFTKEGKNNILIVVPSQEKVSDWAKDGKNLLLDITPLEDTSTSGEGVNVTTYANFVNNEELQKRDFDLVVFDESHRIMENKDGEFSGSTSKFRSLANVTESYALNRIESVTPEYIEIRQLEKSIRDEETALGGSLDQPMEQYITRRSELDARIKKREELQKNYNNNILPKLKDRAKNAHQNTKVVLLSATPFKGHKNLRYANHVLFDWGTEITHQQASRVMSRVDAESRYFLDNFGAAYEWKNHQLQAKKNSNAEAIAMQEVQYAENLINMGVMSGRTIESDMDYARHFPVVTLENAEMFNDALNDIYSGAFQQLRQPAYSVFSDYNYTTKLFESLKASMYIPRIKQHLEMGRKVVLFHRRQQANVTPPFETIIRLTEEAISANEKTLESMKQNGWSENEIQEQADKILQMKIQKSGFLIEYSELFKFEKFLNYAPAVQQIQEAFGDQVMFFNGSVSKQEKSRAVKEFNNDNSNVKIIMIQEEAGKEGISLHDTTGKHQRVLANLSLPISSTTALQIEGRIYRIGNESNAIFEYPLIGLDQEIRDFGSKINKKLSTTENLAIGDQSRDLLRSFSDGVLFNTSTDAPNSEQGIGGREYDRRQQEAMSEFRKAILVYHGNQKQRGSRDSREGVDYYATPEPVGQKMIEWLGLRPGEIAMEPSAGHGAIAMWIPDRANSLVVEPSFKLFSKLNARAGGGNRRMINDTFENLDIINKVDGVAMNPPFGTAGKTAMDHVEKAFKHLHDGGRIVALIPRGKMDERLDKFLYGENEKGKLLNPNAHLVGEILLPSITFDQAGTKVSTRLVVIDKTDNPVESVRHDLTFAETIEELFDAIENINMPERPEKIEPETVADNSFTEQWEQKNSRTGEAMYMVKFRGLVDNDTFSKARGIASKNNGRYSSFKSKADNVRAGFAFSTKEDADKFNSDVASLNKEDAAFKIVGENLPATININGVERPTTNSEGKPIHSTEEGIRNFYEWFGESKVVDEQGRPLVVYHGTDKRFSVFNNIKSGLFFTSNKDVAIGYARPDRLEIMPAYLKITSPLLVNANGKKWDTAFVGGAPVWEAVNQAKVDGKSDGVVFKNIKDPGGFADPTQMDEIADDYIAFYPSQIKSATGNSGDFSTDTDDIRFKIIGEKGAANLDKAEEATTKLDNLRVAKEMEKGKAEKYFVDKTYSHENNQTKGDFYLRFTEKPVADVKNKYSRWYDSSLSDADAKEQGYIKDEDGDYYIQHSGLSGHHLNAETLEEAIREVEHKTNVFKNVNKDSWAIFEANYDVPTIEDTPEGNTFYPEKVLYQRLLNKLITPKQIRMATGWEKGVDGLWRYEVPDGKYKRNIFTIIKEKTKGLTLSDVWVDDYLFKSYPQLKSIPFDIAPIEKGTNGFYDGEKIVLNETLVTDDETQTREELIRSILIHEIQHAIQVIEGFARGGNESQMKTPNDALQKIASPFSFPKLNKEDRAKAKELTKSKGLRFSQSFYFDVISDDADTIDDAIERLEILNKVSPNETYKTLINALELRLMEMGGTNVAFEKYRRLAGEVEARNASTRMNMTAEERRQTLLSETEDVDPKDQIILMDATGDQQSSGMSLEDAQWLSDTLTGVFNVEGTEAKTPTVVVASTKDLIEKLPGFAKQLTAYQVSGINTGDKVYINMEHVKSKEQFVKTWLHEHIHQITIDNYTENGIERFYNSLPAEVKGVLRSGYSSKSNLIKGLEIIAHYTEVLLDSVGLENLMNGNFDLSLVPESVRPILGEHLEIITYGNYQNNRENQFNDSRNDGGTTKGLQTTTARAGYQRDGSIRNTRRGNEDRAAFRITDDVSPLRDVVDAKLRKAVVKIGNRQLGEGFRFKVQENWQDSHIAVKHFLDVLRTNGVVIEDFNDYYLQVTQVPGRTDAQVDHYERMFHKPLMEAIGALQKQGMSYRDVENYAIMKHGIERNEYMRNQEAKIYAEKKVKKPTLKEQELDIDGSVMDEYRAALQDAYESKLISLSDKDYSGITAVAEEVEMTAEEYVAFIEGRITEQAINNFWTTVNNATNNSLEQAFKAGSISKATYEDLKSRYQFYIPLRGFDQEIAEDRYDYAPDMGTYYSLPMISAKGRRSRSENPFAYIWQMNQSAITFANRNLLNQSIKRLSAKDTKGLLTAKKAWYMLTGEIDGVKQWELREPEYSPDWKQYQKNIETFEEEMQELEEKGFASQRGGKLNLGLFTKPKQATQHTVHVMQNGVEYVIYFNADPAVSRAINGSNRTIANPGRVETFVRNASRTMAANFTTRNPVFVLSNFSRDFLYAASTLPAKESAAYAAKFIKNIPLVAASLKRAIKGKPDMTNPIDQLAVEYILNGGKTGYSSIVELQKTQKRIERDLRRHGKSSKAEALLKGIQAANEFAENITRLAVYVTSKQEGRSIIKSISDSKEVTLNFNRNGAGGYGAAFIKSYWLFVNAGIQAMANFYSIAKNHPGKTAAVIATYMAWGVIQPLLISLLGDDDDLEEYFKMSDWERQNNLIFPTGAGFIKIPLPHELRVFHAMGDNIAQTIFGYKDAGETIADTAMSFADLIPISPAGAIDASWVEMLPDAIKPLAQIHFTNTNFMGGRIVDEYKTRSEVMPGYRMARTNKKGEVLSPSFVVGVTKFLDHMTGGDGTQKGLVSMNPDEVNHLLRGYFGGLYTMAVQFGGIAYSGYEWSKGGDLKVKFKDTPLKAFYTSTDELNEKNSGLNKNFYRIKNEAENVLEAGKDYIKRSKEGEFDVIELTKKLNEIDYFRYYEMNERFIKGVERIEGKLDEIPEEYIKEAEVIINSGKENLINFYHDGTKSGE